MPQGRTGDTVCAGIVVRLVRPYIDMPTDRRSITPSAAVFRCASPLEGARAQMRGNGIPVTDLRHAYVVFR